MSTEVVVESNSTRPLYRKLVRDGVPGNYDVITEMVRIIVNDVDYDQPIEAIAKGVLIDAGLDSYASPERQLEAIFNFVAGKVRYIQDIAGRVESLKTARRTLSDGWGDCDDQTICNCTLAGCLGFEDIRIAMAKYGPNAQTFQHVYCVVYVNDRRYVLDTSLPKARFDDEVKPFEIVEVKVFDNALSLKGLSGAYLSARQYARQGAKALVSAVPSAVNVLPLGFVAGSALATGAELIDQAGRGSFFSLSNTASRINEQLDSIIVDLMSSKIAIDLAKTQALKASSELATIEIGPDDKYTLDTVRASIKEKLKFITNFQTYADAHGIKVVHLEPMHMLVVGLALAGGVSYWAFKHFYYRN